MTESKRALSDYIYQSKYSLYREDLGRKEVWEESVERIYQMHLTHLGIHAPAALQDEWFMEQLHEAIDYYKQKKFVGSQRNLQFGGEPVLKSSAKSYNCSYSHCDRLEVFRETEWLLLSGCGCGLSVEQAHVDKLPDLLPLEELLEESEVFRIPDSIEGWSDAIHRLLEFFFVPGTTRPVFDYTDIRPKGSKIAGRFLAPGPDGLRIALDNIRKLLREAVTAGQRRLSALQCTDIIAHLADSVLSGGVRRSALMILFSPEDEEMVNCKHGDWFSTNPQRARFNMSAALDRGQVAREVYERLFEAMRTSGDPGLYWRDEFGIGCNPCCEIGFRPVDQYGNTGWQVCNLVSINGLCCTTEEEFYKICRCASTLATVQATYMDFAYLSPATRNIIESDPLIGVSIGGIMNNPQVLTNPNILSVGAMQVRQQNAKVARILGINPATRTTCVKPDGTVSLLLGMTSGIHGAYAKRYLRSVEANIEEPNLKAYEEANPKAVQPNIFKPTTDKKIFFPIEESEETLLRSELAGLKLLEYVKLVQQSWVIPGMTDMSSPIKNNVSNTVDVPNDQWDVVRDWVWENQDYIAGVTFLSSYGDMDLPQAPMCRVATPEEILREYGVGSMFASGLVVEAIEVFGDLWKACESAQGRGEQLFVSDHALVDYLQKNDLDEATITEEERKHILATLNAKLNDKVENLAAKRDIVRRIIKFAANYCRGDVYKAVNLLKSVNNLHLFELLKKTYKPVDWKLVDFGGKRYANADEQASQSCVGGACEIN
ncbi:hypothetical protein [Porphyromonas sp. oral taxon 275]|uniref:hypothetical protein n=1 Tax=Porphyromonas sp. oral taxon 275 TaxID=712435 RepID=UPI001BA5315A|nr:hypothetical protein [Porphyromonas sp. oral taxon 275]QUB42733.1 hypothetical protein J4862_06935 [Porphyromonas sp. oral taxon 275]